MKPFLLLLGVSGVGKSTIINELMGLDPRFVYINPYTNRPLRLNETEKIYKTEDELNDLERKNELLFINKLYGYIYATPRNLIYKTINENKFPILDFPIQKLTDIKALIPEIYSVYIMPPDIDELIKRLSDRGFNNNRLEFAEQEMNDVQQNKLKGYDLMMINHVGQVSDVTATIYNSFVTQGMNESTVELGSL